MQDLGRLGDLGHGQREVVRFRSEDRLHLLVAHEFLRCRDGGCDIGAVVALHQFEFVGLAADLDAAGVIDLLYRKTDAGWQRVTGGNECAGLRGDDADLDCIAASWASAG